MRNCYILFLLLLLLAKKDSYAVEATVAHRIFYTKDKDSLNPYIELYWQISPTSLNFFEPDTAQIISKIKTTIIITNTHGIEIKRSSYILKTNPVANIDAAYQQNITEVFRARIPFDNIKVQLSLQEVIDSTRQFYYSDSLVVKPINNIAHFSYPQLLDTFYFSNQRNIFSKNNNIQIPLCADFLDQHKMQLSYYSELYIPDSNKISANTLIQTSYISKKPLDNPIYQLVKKDTIKPADVVPIYGKFNIDKLPSGNYYLNLILSNGNNTIADTFLFFQRINNKKKADTVSSNGIDTISTQMQVLDLSSTFVGKYSLPQLKAILKMIKPISNPLEVNAIEAFVSRPDETYIRYFIYNFWKSRNNLNPKLEWENYVALVKEVNKRFGTNTSPGYESERGIVYLKYGKPDEIVTVSNDPNTEPYEIWTYNTLPHQSTGGMLLFYRPAFMLGDYRVLHSNIRGEIRNTKWRNDLYRAGQGGNNLNARAEQYFPGNK